MSERAKLQKKKKVTEDLLDSLLLLPPWRNFAISQSHQSIIESSSQRLPEKMRIDENEGVSASSKHLVFAYYVTGHGFGHATRVVEVVRHLIAAGHDVHVVTGAPDFVFTSEIQSPRLKIRKVLLDCGAVQADALTVDRLASLEKYVETAVVPRAEILETEVEWLHSIKADFVVSDVVPVACRAAADAGIRSVCVTNFR
jgi:L-arabinokinase